MAVDWTAVATAAVGATLDAGSTAATSAFNAAMSKKNRQFQAYMYQNRYKMSMEDMRRAGLNPVLAAGSGLGGGSSPAGSTAQAATPSQMGSRAISSAQQVKMVNVQKQNVQADTGLKVNQASLTDAERRLKLVQQNESFQRAGVAAATAKQIEVETNRSKMKMPREAATEKIYKGPAGTPLRYWNET